MDRHSITFENIIEATNGRCFVPERPVAETKTTKELHGDPSDPFAAFGPCHCTECEVL